MIRTAIFSLLSIALFILPLFAQDSSNVTQVSQIAYSGNIWALDVSGDYAYVADSDTGVRILDVSEPTNPLEVGIYVPHGDVNDVAVSGDYLYVADLTGLRVVDIANPASPIEVGYCRPPDGHGVEVFGNYAYVFCTLSSAVAIIDVMDPIQPAYQGLIAPSGWGAGVSVVGTHAYVPECLGGFGIYDISDPTSPMQTGYCGIEEGSCDIAVSGDYAYLTHLAGLKVLDVSNPFDPFEVTTYAMTSLPGKITLSGIHVYIADYVYGLRIFNIQTPVDPYEVGFYQTTGNARDVAVSGRYTYVATGNYFDIYDCWAAQPVEPGPPPNSPIAFTLFHAFPNPFNLTTQLSFTLPSAGPTSLKIYDLSGCSIATILDQHLPPGSHSIQFDGRHLTSGVYLAVLESGAQRAVQRLLLLK